MSVEYQLSLTAQEINDKLNTVIDQNYNSNSENAQSGKAVAEAVDTKISKISIGKDEGPFNGVVTIENGSNKCKLTFVDDGFLGKNALMRGHLVLRDFGTGNIWTGTPIDDEDCANKKYVDNAVNNRAP